MRLGQYQWKMQFNPDKNKQAIQVFFSQKRTKPVHPPIFLNESEVKIKDEQKHLGMIPDSRLNFNSHMREKIISARRGISVIRYLSICMFQAMFFTKRTSCM